MKIWRKTKNIVFEGLLIIFSVLFALLINNVFLHYNTIQRKKAAIEEIKTEIKSNLKILDNWMVIHSATLENVQRLMSETREVQEMNLLANGAFNMAYLTNDSNLINDILSNTAWQTAQSSHILTEFEFETTQVLTRIYTMQSIIQEKSLQGILDVYYDKDTHNAESVSQTLIVLEIRLRELMGQENLLKEMLEDSLLKL